MPTDVHPLAPPPPFASLEDGAPLLAPTVADVDLGALRHNARVLAARAGRARLLGVVKANAYGHGADRVARVLYDEGVRHFAVATLPEALALRRGGLDAALLVLGAPLPGVLPHYVAHGLEVNVASDAVAEAVVATARTHGPLRAHLKVDTGMHRLGVPPAQAAAVARRLADAPGVTLAGLWTHFATADDEDASFAEHQLRLFTETVRPLVDLAETVHVANSAAVLRLPDAGTLLDLPGKRVLARAGIGLYGLSGLTGLAEASGLRPVMRLASRVTHVQTLDAGETVSYGRRWRAERPTRIATVSAGYADGYPRALTNRGEVGIGGRRYPVAGTVCMDMIMVDLGAPDGPGDGVQPGDEVVLFGAGGPSTEETAHRAGTIAYELCCGIAPRVPRRYHDAAPARQPKT